MFCKKILHLQSRHSIIRTLYRTFLSKEYKCSTEWESRLAAPIMQKVKLDTLYYEIDQTFNQQGKASAIDIDIFVNKVNDDSHIDEVEDLIHRLRMTEETSNCLESTGHAVIRNYVDTNHIDEIIQILNNPLQYGVFLDDYIANYVMDECIKRENYSAAARIAVFQMLQEDFENELTKTLSLYSCYKYLITDPKPFYPVENKKDDDDTEVIKVRVKYIRNEYFDDHFDLRNHFHLVGKTLAMIGSLMKDNTLGKSVELLGNVLYQKYDKAISILKSSSSSDFHKEILQKCIEHLKSNIPEGEEKNTELQTELETLLNATILKQDLKQNNILEDIEKLVKECVQKHESNEIENQKQKYKRWNEIRQNKFNDELQRLRKIERLKEIERIQNEMKDEEQKLWFFENEEKINLVIDDDMKSKKPKRSLDKQASSKDSEDGYIPPEVTKQRV